jgi:hypothetical protein
LTEYILPEITLVKHILTNYFLAEYILAEHILVVLSLSKFHNINARYQSVNITNDEAGAFSINDIEKQIFMRKYL